MKKKAKIKKPKSKKLTQKQSGRISTGIKKLDSLIQGGYKRYSINLIEGGPGSGKTILATHFLMDGLKKKEKCMYITFELGREKYYSDMKTLGWDLESYEKSGLFTF